MENDTGYTIDKNVADAPAYMPLGEEIKVTAYVIGKDDILPAARPPYQAGGQKDAAAERVLELLPNYRVAIQQAVAELGSDPAPDVLEAKIREIGTSVFGPRFRLLK